MPSVLVVDDDKNICELLQMYLKNENFTAYSAYSGEDALCLFKSKSPDIIVLDVMLPGIDGWQVCREVRKTSSVPIIMVTTQGDTFDKVLGLELGADDYISKPFEIKEVMARIKAVLRRTSGSLSNSDESAESANGKVIEYENIIIDKSRYELTISGKLVDTPAREFELLYCLASHPNIVFTRDELLNEVWGFDYYGDSRTIDVHVKRLREKLENASEKWSLKTVWGVGYKFEADEGNNK